MYFALDFFYLLDLIPEFTGTVLVEKLDLVDKTTTPAQKCLDFWRFFAKKLKSIFLETTKTSSLVFE